MVSKREPGIIRWRLHLKSPPHAVYTMFSTDEGRAKFWAESAVETHGIIEFRFPNGLTLRSRILERKPPSQFTIEYFGGSIVTFDLADDGAGGTDLNLIARQENPEYWVEELPGWVSVLMALKAATDFSVDLRNHDLKRTWDQGYVDN